MRTPVALSALVLAACGMPVEEFVPEYTQLWCEHRMACDDSAVLLFEGIATVDDCVERTLPDTTRWGQGCSYDGRKAELCLTDVETKACPAGDAELSPPPSCDTVFVNCTAGDRDDGSDTEASDPEE